MQGELDLVRVHIRMRYMKCLKLFTCSGPADQGSKLVPLVSCKLSNSVESSGSKDNQHLVEVDCEVPTLVPNDLSHSRMAKTKQTTQKGADYN